MVGVIHIYIQEIQIYDLDWHEFAIPLRRFPHNGKQILVPTPGATSLNWMAQGDQSVDLHFEGLETGFQAAPVRKLAAGGMLLQWGNREDRNGLRVGGL